MKYLSLLDIPRNSKIYEPCTDGSTWFTMCHPDGLYSFCRTEKGAIVHLGIMQPLAKHEDGYKFAPELEDSDHAEGEQPTSSN